MLCRPCTRQLFKRGRHRAHHGCLGDVLAGSVLGPCWCPACHPISASYDPPPMLVATLEVSC